MDDDCNLDIAERPFAARHKGGLWISAWVHLSDEVIDAHGKSATS